MIGIDAGNGHRHGIRRQEQIVPAHHRHPLRHGQTAVLAGLNDLHRLNVGAGKDGQGPGGRFEAGRQPLTFAFPLLPVVAEAGDFVPAQPFAVVARLLERGHESLAPLFQSPVFRVAVIKIMPESPRQKMVGHQLAAVRVVNQHTRKGQVRTAPAEINRRLAGLLNEIRQIIALPQPGQDAVALPAPRDELLTGVNGREVPVVFAGILLDAAMHGIVVPA